MAVTNTPIYPQAFIDAHARIQNSDGTNLVTLRTGSTNGDKIESIGITSTDTSARVMTFVISSGGVDYTLGTVNVPITAGTDAAATAAVSALESNSMMPFLRKDQNGRRYLYLASGSVLKAKSQVTVTSAKEIHFNLQIGVF